MSSPPKKSAPNFGNEGMGFESLDATPAYDVQAAARAEREAAKSDTDFHALNATLQRDVKRYQNKTATDLLVDFFTPFMILAMVSSVLFFLLDVRFIYTGVHYSNLRFVALALILGIVALNRMIARQGSEESFMYIVALVAVTAIYTWSLSWYDVGSLAGNFMDRPGVSIVFNTVIVVILWWTTNRLTHECCVDENETAGDIGILTGTARRFQKAIQRSGPKPEKRKKPSVRRPAGHLLEEADRIEAIDPLEWKEPEKKQIAPVDIADTRPPERHPGISVLYFSVPAMIIFALGLPVLMQGGYGYINAGHFYVGAFTFAALSLLMLSSLGGLRHYFRQRRVRLPDGIGWFWLGLGGVMIAMVMIGALRLPLPGLPNMAAIKEHEFDAFGGRDFRLQSPVAAPAELIRQTEIVDKIGVVVLWLFAIVFVFALLRLAGGVAAWIGRRRDLFPPFIVDAFDALDGVLQRLLQLPRLPSFKVPRRVRPDVALSSAHHNPMKGEGHAEFPDVQRYVAQTYDALCALAEDMGVPRSIDQTPYEFIQAFPKELRGIKKDARILTEMYVRSAYSPDLPDEHALDRLRKFWVTYEKIRGRHIR